jgi:hypothetical protein
MVIFYKITRKDAASVVAGYENEIIWIKSKSKDDRKYVVLDREDWEAIMWNYQYMMENKNKKKKKGTK